MKEYWVVVDELGIPCVESISLLKDEATKKFVRSLDGFWVAVDVNAKWDRMQRQGYRCVKCEIVIKSE